MISQFVLRQPRSAMTGALLLLGAGIVILKPRTASSAASRFGDPARRAPKGATYFAIETIRCIPKRDRKAAITIENDVARREHLRDGGRRRSTRVLPEKWEPVFRKEARQNKELGSVHDSIKTGQTLDQLKSPHAYKNTGFEAGVC
jgi:hypothetical protein